MNTVKDIKQQFYKKYTERDFTGNTIELINANFIADQETIFGDLNIKYIANEIQWYFSKSLNVNDLQDCPKIWKDVSSSTGQINSNYGYLIFSEENYSQFSSVLDKLTKDMLSRQAIMIYTRPSMHIEWQRNGMKDFICTSTVQYLIRNSKLETIVTMRSNDAVFGYKNDRMWQLIVRDTLLLLLKNTYPDLIAGNLYWNVGSLHLYERHYKLLI